MTEKKRPNQVTVVFKPDSMSKVEEMRQSSGLTYTGLIELAVRKLYASGELNLNGESKRGGS